MSAHRQPRCTRSLLAPVEAFRTDEDEDFAARARAWAKRTRAEQGLPAKISDPAAIRKVAEILRSARPTAPA